MFKKQIHLMGLVDAPLENKIESNLNNFGMNKVVQCDFNLLKNVRLLVLDHSISLLFILMCLFNLGPRRSSWDSTKREKLMGNSNHQSGN